MKTENPTEVGKHAFEVAGLGKAPFRFFGVHENLIRYADGSTQPGGTCDYCGTGIKIECWIQGADGRQFKVGCNCIAKVGDTGLLKAYQSSPEVRAKARAARAAKSQAVSVALRASILANAAFLAALPHPLGFSDRQTGNPLTALDWAKWRLNNCGTAGRASLLRKITSLTSTPERIAKGQSNE